MTQEENHIGIIKSFTNDADNLPLETVDSDENDDDLFDDDLFDEYYV